MLKITIKVRLMSKTTLCVIKTCAQTFFEFKCIKIEIIIKIMFNK